MVKQKMAKSLLLRAWRERWTDMQWSINIKHLIQPDNVEDMQQLADLMIQQALMGSTPNMLVLSYLKHTISSKLISLVCAIHSVVKFSDVGKPYCMKSLIEVMEVFVPSISCRGTTEDSLALAGAAVSFLHWLLDVMTKFLQKLGEGKLPAEYATLLERACDVLDKLLAIQENRALLYVGKHENPAMYGCVEEAEASVWSMIGQLQNNQLESNLRVKLRDTVDKLSGVQNFPMNPQQNLDVSFHPLNISLNVVTGIEAVLNPTNDIHLLIEQLLVIERAQGLSRPTLYCELLRTCMLGMTDAAGGTDELKWASFTFLKLPHILKQLVKQRPDKSSTEELEQGIYKLLEYVPLLDATDTKCQQAESHKQRPTEQPSQQPSAGLIIRAETTLYSILKTLDADYSKNQEPLRGVLSQMMSGKSLELILAAAAARGKVHNFALKIIKFNELSKHASGELINAAQIRATIFDISFLMLCHISQLYGLQMVTGGAENNSFFAQWASRCLPEDTKYKSLDLMQPADDMKVDSLLSQINPGGELMLPSTRWHEVCQNIPYVMQEVLYAWEHGALSKENVQGIVENLKCRMCCLPVIVVAWLCSFISVSDSQARVKPLQIIQWFITPSSNDPTNTKCNLMLSILRRMVQELLPQTSGMPHRSVPYTLPSTTPIGQALVTTYTDVFNKGCIDIQSIHIMDYLLNVGGTLWFCENIVKEVLTHDRVEDINKGVSLAYALFHLDLDRLTLDLVHQVVPQMLQVAQGQLKTLMDPKGRALAGLIVMCLCVCHKVKTVANKESSPVKRGKKRSRTELELEEPEDNLGDSRAQKLRRLSSACEELLPPSFGTDAFALSNALMSKEEPEPTYDTTDTLNKSLVNLFRLFSSILAQKEVSPRSGFVSSFIEETLKCGSGSARFILQFMPSSMVSQLVKSIDGAYSSDVLLHMCDLNTNTGRKVAAKVICQHARSTAQETATLS